ncbi:hypothetical protein POM88_029793 [Heracleum sosnowskyi]|uniref:HAT C-terminal dimerisation domain-containing protein n=1 Tax=Heracleum sosnowskyi TaxID=360622 RepID=A0AAD8HX70_9APIA|nr:hypothetical protein POM88_029793 [Heracleum sosnowskyi]
MENLISIGDETPSDDTGEQEEISRKRKGKSVGCKDSQATPDTQQSKQTEDEPYKKKPRKKNSACWEFLDIVVEGVNKWAVCKLCKTRMAKTPTTGTTTFNRHVDKCKIKHGLSKQTQLQFQSEKLYEDVLSIPISTVASESTFSAGGRVIEPHRSCLKPKTVEMLLCGADWARELYGLKKSEQKDSSKEIEIVIDLNYGEQP